MKKNITSLIVLALLILVNPGISEARHNDSNNWNQSSSAFSQSINDLDDDPVDEIAVPVLFGVDLDDITENFGAPRGGGTRLHEGLDMLAPIGTPIVSPTEAVVRNTGFGNSAGNYVYTINPGGEVFAYLHLDEIARGLEAGDELKKGDFIGTVGYTGNAVVSAPHLHFEIQVDGKATDPYPRIAKEFDLEDKMEYLHYVFDSMSSSDEEDLVELMTERYLADIKKAQREDIDIPREIEQELEQEDRDDNLLASIDSSTLDCSIDYSRLIRLWTRGSDVKQVQRCMNSLGFSTGIIDGIYGPNTYAGITAYQRNAGLKYIDGIVGPETSGALNDL